MSKHLGLYIHCNELRIKSETIIAKMNAEFKASRMQFEALIAKHDLSKPAVEVWKKATRLNSSLDVMTADEMKRFLIDSLNRRVSKDKTAFSL